MVHAKALDSTVWWLLYHWDADAGTDVILRMQFSSLCVPFDPRSVHFRVGRYAVCQIQKFVHLSIGFHESPRSITGDAPVIKCCNVCQF
ncbi:hypothetical protein MPTK1_3g17860 [Marchantia polymorpha subsp. ruderalis]|uniref:Uncharacterized protein n=2 Tax=Marchantia polymorpha TaxID=3197 RepID=A0AAF6B203_MARPO|nr:hypothetical protein MARPO_0039s0010 [Marchantia polymorpha]BBN06037.1 hypothetical protein Mp_3g17860 [Marchantia polymorpha subsp. ruderalis]|eukprot:PTQ40491.1 hypothetical protein MARPO_0039s0010 [Marchantia polymorpha]